MAGPTLRTSRGHAAPAQPSLPDERYLQPGASEARLTRVSAPRPETGSSGNRKGRADTKGGGRARTSHRKKGTDRRSANVSSAGGPESPSSEELRHKPREERSYKEFYSDLDVLSPMLVTVEDGDVTFTEKDGAEFESPAGQELRAVKNGEDPNDSVENKDALNITADDAQLPQVMLNATHVFPDYQANFSRSIMHLAPESASQGAPQGDPLARLDNEDNLSSPKGSTGSLGVDCTRTCHRILAGEVVNGEETGAVEITQLDGGPVHDGVLDRFKERLLERGTQLPAPSTCLLRHAVPSSGSGVPTANTARQLPKPTFRAVDRNELVRAAIDYQWPGRQKLPRVRPAQHYIHYVEPTETELAERVEYDMDEQDREWLEALNEQRAQEGKVTYELFELMIDRLEKEWFDLTKDLQKAANSREEPLSAEESKCAICDDGECENSNAIVFCDGCNLAVHQICYGIPYVPEGQWLCRKCMVMPEKAVKCMFCPNEGGAFKMTANRQWGHLLCALWIPEVGVSNPVLMEPIDQTDTISPKRWRLICYICRKRHGVCIQCEYRSCATAYHVTCARKAKLYMRMKTHGTHYDRTTFRAYCDKHSPPDYRGQEDVEGAREALGVVLTRKKLARIAPSAGAPEPANGSPQNAVPDGDDDAAGGVGRAKTGEDKAAQAHQFEYKANGVVAPAYVFNRVLQQISRFQLRKKAAVLNFVCRYWSLKREARRGAPLLKRLHLEPWTASSSALRQTEEEKARKFQAVISLRRTLERQRTLAELLRKRERAKLERTRVMKMYVEELFYPIGRILMEMLDHLKKSDTQSYFAEPVSTADAPDYLDVIETPMDFSTMHRRIQELRYDSVDAFASDAELVFSNAIRYNRHDTVWHRAAVRVRRTLPALVREAKRKCDELGSTTVAHLAPEEVRERFDATLFDYTLEADEGVACDPAGDARGAVPVT